MKKRRSLWPADWCETRNVGSVTILPRGDGDRCLMMECQIPWYCIFPKAPGEHDEDYSGFSHGQTSLWEVAFILIYNQQVMGKNVWPFRRQEALEIHQWTHIHTQTLSVSLLSILTLHTVLNLLISHSCSHFLVISRPSAADINLWAGSDFKQGHTWVIEQTLVGLHTRMCAQSHTDLLGRRGQTTVQSHYCWCMVFAPGCAVLLPYSSFIKGKEANKAEKKR